MGELDETPVVVSLTSIAIDLGKIQGLHAAIKCFDEEISDMVVDERFNKVEVVDRVIQKIRFAIMEIGNYE